MTIRRRTYAAVRWTTLSAIFRAGLQILQTAVLARILNPVDYGLMAIVTVVLGFASLFSDFGLSSAFIQQQEVSEDQRSALFWINAALGCAIGGALCAASPFMSSIYTDQRLTALIALSAITVPLGSVSAQIRASAEKNLKFAKIACIEMGAASAGAIVAIVLAIHGIGVRALVCGAIASAVMSAGLNWLYNASGWRPALTFRVSAVAGFARFGGSVVANNVVNYVNAAADVMIGGRVLDPLGLGAYSVPRDLSLRIYGVINPVITRVGFPLIALVQGDSNAVREIYRRTVSMSSAVNAPIYVGLSVFATEVVQLWLGNKWSAAAPLLSVLALWGGVRSTANPAGSLVMGMGRPSLALVWNLLLMVLTPGAIAVGLHWGAMGMAVAVLVLQLLLFVPGWRVLIRPLCDLKLGSYVYASGLPFLLATMAWLTARLMVVQVESVFWRAIDGAVIAAALYVALTMVANREIYNSARDLVFHRGGQ